MEDKVFNNHKTWAEAVKERDNWACRDCGATVEQVGSGRLQAHRIVPGIAGGKLTLANGKTVCKPCHHKAHTGVFANRKRKDPGQRRITTEQVAYVLGISKPTVYTLMEAGKLSNPPTTASIREYVNWRRRMVEQEGRELLERIDRLAERYAAS